MPQHQLALPTAPQGTTGPTLVSVDGKTFPLREVTIEARAEAGLALTTLTQTYANPYDEPLEVHYTLPLPADGAVLGFTMTLGTRTITSEVHPAEEAAALYERAIETGRAASLMQQHRTDTFTQSLGNLPPKTEAKIQIHLLHPLAFIPD
jgi:Ca-activated chloride channel family protein